MAISLRQQLLAASSSLPETSLTDRAGPAGFNRPSPLLGLAPGGVYLAGWVTPPAGELLPHRFTLTLHPRAVCFLLHFPWSRNRSALPTTLPFGARTFLSRFQRNTSDHPPHCVPIN